MNLYECFPGGGVRTLSGRASERARERERRRQRFLRDAAVIFSGVSGWRQRRSSPESGHNNHIYQAGRTFFH